MASTISTTSPLSSEYKPAIRGRKSGSNENRFIAQQFYAHQKIIHYMLIYMLIFSFGAQALVTQLAHGCKSLWIDCDGNKIDPDDFGASHMGLVLLKAAEAEDLLVGITYNNEFEGNNNAKATAMRNAHLRGSKLGYNTANWHDASTSAGKVAGTNALKNAIVAATATKKLCILGGGPYQLIYDAIKLAGSSNLANVRVVTHSVWNMEKLSASPNDKNYTNLMADFPATLHTQIVDQNTQFGSDQTLRYSGADLEVADNYVFMDKYQYLRSYSTANEVSNAVYTAYQTILDEFAFKNRQYDMGYGDISDVGVIMYLLTGQEVTTQSQLRTIIECGIQKNGALTRPNSCISTSAPAPAPVAGKGRLVLVKNPNTAGATVHPITSNGLTFKIPAGTSYTIGFEAGVEYVLPYDGVKIFLTRPSPGLAFQSAVYESIAPFCINSDGGSGTVSNCYALDEGAAVLEGSYIVEHKLRRGTLFDGKVSFQFYVSKTSGQ